MGSSWWLDCDVRSYSICLAALENGDSQSLEVWHKRLGHLNKRDVERLAAGQIANGIKIGVPPLPNKLQCRGCLVGKDYRQISRHPRQEVSPKLAVVFADICRPMWTVGLLGSFVYFCVFVDAKTRFT